MNVDSVDAETLSIEPMLSKQPCSRSLMMMSLMVFGSLKLLFWHRSKTGLTPQMADIGILKDKKISGSGFGDVIGIMAGKESAMKLK